MRVIVAILTTIIRLATASYDKNTTIFKKYQAHEQTNWEQPLPEEWANEDGSAWFLDLVREKPNYKKLIKNQEDEREMIDHELGKLYAEWQDKMDLNIVNDRFDKHHNASLPTIYVFQKVGSEKIKGRKAMVHIHGGNGFGGTGLQNLRLYEEISKNTDTVIFSPRYRLTPTFKAPIPQQDVAATIEYVYLNAHLYGVNKEKILVSGDSAGGNIATGAALLLKDRHEDFIKCLILFQPMINDFIYSKPRKLATKGEQNTAEVILKSFELLSTDFNHQQHDPMIFPGKMSMKLAKELPPTVLITSEFDLFKRDAYDFKQKLDQAGTLLDFADYQQVGHNSFNDAPIDNYVLKQFFADWITILKTYVD